MHRPQNRPTRRAFLLAAVSLLSVLSASCGRSVVGALAPARAPVAQAGSSGGPAKGGDTLDGQLVATLADGVDAGSVAASYHATLLAFDCGERAASFLPAAGQTVATLQALLAADARVVTAEPNGWLETAETRQQSFAFDDGFGSAKAVAEQPAAAAIDLTRAHEVALGRGVVVAILDTGIDRMHPMLRFAYAGGHDFVDDDDDPSDVRDLVDNDGDGHVDEAFGHGTHVAGIVHLVAPEARLLAVRVLDADGRGDILKIAAGVRWAVAHGAKVINLSLGSLKSSDALQNALGEAENMGVVVITSAGNWGASTPEEYPARSSHAAAIAAVDASDAPATFSSFGQLVALSAPGVAVRSAFPGGGYRLWSGTSMAAPFVTGTAALLAETHPNWTLDDMIARMGATASPVPGNDRTFGAGALDAGAALAPDRRSHVDDVPLPEVARRH
jgi:subtilisin family serine protease